MIFEILSTSLMGAIVVKAQGAKSGISNDSKKINRIFSLSGLNVKDGKETLTAQQVSKKDWDWGTEYKYRIPLGRSFEDYLAKQKTIEAGINTRKFKVVWKDLQELTFDRHLIQNIKTLKAKKLTDRKEIELSYDGLLHIRVYNEPLPEKVPYIHAVLGWKVLLGVTREENKAIIHDFEIIPHFALGGTSRYGKSNLLQNIIISLLKSQPEHVHFYLIDLKGGVEFCDYENLKQTVSIAYEPDEALYTLQKAYNQMRLVQQRVRAMGKKNVQEAGIKERHFIIIDEVGELNPEEAVDKKDIKKDGVIIHKSEKTIKEECQLYMSKIARLGASNGFRQILATQYPTGDVIPRACKQNSDAKLCFRVQTATASRVVLDGEGAEQLPRIRGRAVYQSANDNVVVQTPLMTPEIIQQTIEPYIIEGGSERNEHIEEAEPKTGSHTFIIEETRLS